MRALPFQFTVELGIKPVPFTVSVKAAAPAVAPVGVTEVRLGSGLGAVMANAIAPEVPPPGAGLTTVTEALPAAAISAAVMAAMSCVALPYVVVRGLPFQFTVEPETKPLPVTVSVKPAAPAVAPAGDNDVSAGSGFGVVGVGGELCLPQPAASTAAAITIVVHFEPMASLPCAREIALLERMNANSQREFPHWKLTYCKKAVVASRASHLVL
jgi:hypothetical protein